MESTINDLAKQVGVKIARRNLACPAGVEPATYGLEGQVRYQAALHSDGIDILHR